MNEWIEWLNAYSFELPLELQIKATEILQQEKQQIIDAYDAGLMEQSNSIDYYNKTFKPIQIMEIEDFTKAFNLLVQMPIPKQDYTLTLNINTWKKIRCYYNWTDEELSNAINGYIGEKNGIKCYIHSLF